MDLLFWLLLGGVALAIPFVLPIVSWIYAYGTRTRVQLLERALQEQQEALDRLTARLVDLQRETRAPVKPVMEEGAEPAPAAVAPMVPTRPVETTPPAPTVEPGPAGPLVEQKPLVPPKPPVPPIEPRPSPPTVTLPAPERPPAAQPAAASARSADAVRPPPRPPFRDLPPPPPPPPSILEPLRPSFDWESLVGVKLFSAIAGVALVVAAIFFLRYSIEHGWLQPPVRVLIGILVGIALLVVCEMKAARRYPATANALDAAAIAILFSTFFAAHALWDLIPASITFALLAMVTAVAVLLSIRRESLFIAVLGLLGGFATPALLSTNENRPIPLFAYLLLLNVGLAWVAQRQAWPILSVLTLILTTIYQWGWVLKFLAESPLPLAMGIFIVFPVVTFAFAVLARRGGAETREGEAGATYERTALVSAALPLLFAIYLAAVPQYGARPVLLFGFLLLINLGLMAIAIARQQPLLHASGAAATLLVFAIWLAASYESGAGSIALGFTAAFVLLFLGAPLLAGRFARPLEGVGELAEYAAPALLFVFPALVALDPAFAAPVALFATLVMLVGACAARAIVTGRGSLYFIATFFALAAQAVWSTAHLTPERLPTAVAIYALFGAVSLGVPLLARRLGKPLEPDAAPGVALLASLALLLYLTSGSIAPEALWALALLLAILNAGIFIESASVRLPLLSQAGSAVSWTVLAVWWWRAAGSVGLLPSLAVLTGLTLVTLGGHAWAVRHNASRPGEAADSAGFSDGLYIGLVGHLFLFTIALNRAWSVPPWPMFGTLLVVTLATTAAALATRVAHLHMSGVIAASVVVAAWTAVAAVAPWTLTGIVASGVIAAYALVWFRLGDARLSRGATAAAAFATLFAAEITAILAAAAPGPPAFLAILIAHAVFLTVLLAMTWTMGWHAVALGAVAIGAVAVFQWQLGNDLATAWRELLVLAGAVYAIFTAYPLVLGRRAAGVREPWVAALAAAATTFFAAREAFQAGQLEWMIGAIPVAQGLVTAVLLRALLRIEAPGQRDLGRLALVAGAALAFVTVAIPLQLENQWWTIGWALEGAALAWLYRRIPHKGLLYATVALLAAVFVRLALNPEVFRYEPRGELRILNWYLYTYAIAAVALLVAAWGLRSTDDSLLEGLPRPTRLLPAGAVVLLFLLLNIEIADFYATGPEIVFRFGAGLSQDLTYTIGWLVFGMLLLAAGIYSHTRAARITAVALIAVTTFKCFLYDLGSLQGLYRVGSFVGLAISLALVSVALQKFVLSKPRETI